MFMKLLFCILIQLSAINQINAYDNTMRSTSFSLSNVSVWRAQLLDYDSISIDFREQNKS